MSDEVRLWLLHGAFGVTTSTEVGPPAAGAQPYIAVRAAKHEAMVKVMKAVKARIDYEDGKDGVGFSDAVDREHHRWLVKRENAAYRAYEALIATAPDPKVDGSKDGCKEDRRA